MEFASAQMADSETELYPGNDAVATKRKAPSGEGLREASNGYELNFNDAELSELAKVILRDTLSLPYVFDPRVQGRVTVSTGGPVSRRELLSILESVLAMHRGALVIDGKLYRIVPEAEARQNAVLSVSYDQEHKEVGRGLRDLDRPLEVRVGGDDDAHAVLARFEPGPAARQRLQQSPARAGNRAPPRSRCSTSSPCSTSTG